MENYNYNYTSHPNSHTIAKSSKIIHKMWNDNLQCGIEYHTSTHTQKQTYISLLIGYDLKIPLPPSTSTEKAITMLEKMYSKMYMQISKESKKSINSIDELDEFYGDMYDKLKQKEKVTA